MHVFTRCFACGRYYQNNVFDRKSAREAVVEHKLRQYDDLVACKYVFVTLDFAPSCCRVCKIGVVASGTILNGTL